MMPSIPLLLTILVMISSLGQVTSDLYLPSLPFIRSGLQTTTTLTQLTVSVFMLGFSCSQLVYGPVSDAVGRRRPLLFGLTICMLSGLVCILAPTIYVLLLGRLFQGLGAGAGMALARSIMRDRFDGNNLASMGSYLSMINVFVMASAPVIGGYMQLYVGWRSNFVVLFVYALASLLMVIAFLPESNQQIDNKAIEYRTLIGNFKTILSNNTFVGYASCVFFAYAGVLAWLTTGPILLQEGLGLTPVQFGWLAILVGLAFVVGGFGNAMLVHRFGPLRMLRVGFFFMLLAGLMMLGFGLLGYTNFTVIIIPLFGFLFGCAFIFPNSFAGAMMPFPHMAGLAGALFGFAQIMGGALSSLLMSYLPDNSQIPIAIVFTCYAIAASIMTWLFIKE